MQALYDKIDLLNQKAYSLIYSNISKADELARETRQLATEADYPPGVAWSLMISGLMDIEYGYLDQAEGKIFQAHRILNDRGNDMGGLIAAENALGLICIRQGKMKEAFEHLQQALDSSRLHDLKEMEFRAVNLLGILQFHMENYNQALRFFNKALKLRTGENLVKIFNNLGCCYRAIGKYDLALEFLNRALKEAEYQDNYDARIPILEEIGLIYGKTEDYEKGIEILKSALSFCTEHHNRYKLSINSRLGELYIKKENYDEAEKALEEARKYITLSNSTNHRDLYLYLSGLNEIKGDYREALINYKNYHLLTGKVKSNELDQRIWELETESFEEVNSKIRKIGEMGKYLTALLDWDQVVETLYRSVITIFDIDCFSIGLYSPDQNILELKFFDSRSERRRNFALDTAFPTNPESWVAVHRSGVVFNNLKEDYKSYFTPLRIDFYEKDIHSVLCLPFDVGNEKGIIAIYSIRNSAFNREDYEILELLNSYATIALSNALQTKIIKEKNRELEILNKYDDLTGIYNRRHFSSELEKMWKLCSRGRKEIHLMIIDIDHFKGINDTYGHSAGDQCLKALGRKFGELLQRSSDLFARYGGEEFIVALQDLTFAEAEEMAERIRASVEEQKIEWMEQVIGLTISIGLCSTIPPDRDRPELEKLINEADKNLYKSKAEGRNRVFSSRQ